MSLLGFDTVLDVDDKRFASIVLQGLLYEGGVCVTSYYSDVRFTQIGSSAFPFSNRAAISL